jgi:hypothetical protein
MLRHVTIWRRRAYKCRLEDLLLGLSIQRHADEARLMGYTVVSCASCGSKYVAAIWAKTSPALPSA